MSEKALGKAVMAAERNGVVGLCKKGFNVRSIYHIPPQLEDPTGEDLDPVSTDINLTHRKDELRGA